MRILDLKQVPQFLPTLAQWHQAQWSYLNPGENLHHRIARMQAYLDEHFIPSTFVAVNASLAGSAAIVAHDMDTRPELSPWLASVYIAPDYRHQGVATELIKHVQQQARQHGIKELYLFTPDEKVAFYLQRGWQLVEATLYRGSRVIIMSCRLEDQTTTPAS
jgi:N-acetylglutamate synthase-like GNAT family acetyltransferase